MLIKNSGIHFPTLVDLIGEAGAGQNVEGEILALRAAHIRVAVDPTEAETAGKIRNDAPVRLNKLVTAAAVHAEIMIFNAADSRLRHQRERELIVATRPVVAVVHAPANPARDKLRRDLVT